MPVSLRAVADDDLPIFYEHQRDPVGVAMAGVPSRDEEAFFAHWKKIRADPNNYMRTIEADGVVAGNVVSWQGEEGRLVGYWVGREHWGKGIATAALNASTHWSSPNIQAPGDSQNEKTRAASGAASAYDS